MATQAQEKPPSHHGDDGSGVASIQETLLRLPPVLEELLYGVTDKISKQFGSRKLKNIDNKVKHSATPPLCYQSGDGNQCIFYFSEKTLSTRLKTIKRLAKNLLAW